MGTMKIGEGTLTREAKKTSTNLKIEQRDKRKKIFHHSVPHFLLSSLREFRLQANDTNGLPRLRI